MCLYCSMAPHAAPHVMSHDIGWTGTVGVFLQIFLISQDAEQPLNSTGTWCLEKVLCKPKALSSINLTVTVLGSGLDAEGAQRWWDPRPETQSFPKALMGEEISCSRVISIQSRMNCTLGLLLTWGETVKEGKGYLLMGWGKWLPSFVAKYCMPWD